MASFDTPRRSRMLARMPRVKVSLGTKSYDVVVASNCLSEFPRYARALKLGNQVAIISDHRVAPLFAPAITASLKKEGFIVHRITIPAGERSKSLEVAKRCYDQLAAKKFERNSTVLALGGGVVGDLAGFVAASYLRGINLVQAPTSLLAQVDSSVGGKVGVNLRSGKNLVGAFYQPRLVLCDLGTLETLPERELRAGLAEVIKYGAISDPQLFGTLERSMDDALSGDPALLEMIVTRSCEIKAAIVSQDEKEEGLRAILNFGHTIGHALEAVLGYGRLLHGEAIALGQIAAARLSQACGLAAESMERIVALMARAGLPTAIKLSGRQITQAMETMQVDKKVRQGEIRFVLLKSLGNAVPGQAVSSARIRKELETLAPGNN